MRPSRIGPRVLGALMAALIAAGLGGCPAPMRKPEAISAGPSTSSENRIAPVGRRYTVVSGQSRLVVLVYRAGVLAALGHNHVIDCRCIAGTLYVPSDPMGTSFELRIPVKQLTVDDPTLRAAQHSAEFPPDVPQSAREGTRRNMLGAAVLDAEEYPMIEVRSERLQRAPLGGHGEVLAHALIEVRGRSHPVTLAVHYALRQGELTASGSMRLDQTTLGLTPFSVLLGALRVKNAIMIHFHLVAKRT